MGWLRVTAVWVGALMAIACPAPTTLPDAVPDSAPDAGGGDRTYLLGGVAAGYKMEGLQRWGFSTEVLFREANESADEGANEPSLAVEAVVFPAYLFGIPWTDFAKDDVPQNLPGAWVSQLQAAREVLAALSVPLVLSLSPVSGEFDNLAPLASDDGTGGLGLEENWLNDYCYDPSQSAEPEKWRTAYARYVSWMVDLFDPQMVVLARRINLYDANCGKTRPGAYPALVGFATAAHELLAQKQGSPTTIVSVDVEDLYGYPRLPGRCPSLPAKECFEQRKGLLEPIQADRLGLASYPAVALPNIVTIPNDWLGVISDARADLKPLVTGSGLPATRLETIKGTCVPLLESSQSVQLAWLDHVLSFAGSRRAELVVWDSPVNHANADIVSACLCSGDPDLCAHLSQLGAKADSIRLALISGLFSAAGTPTEAALLWDATLQSQ